MLEIMLNFTVWSNQTVSHRFMLAVSKFHLYFELALLLLCVIGYFLARIRHGFTGFLYDTLNSCAKYSVKFSKRNCAWAVYLFADKVRNRRFDLIINSGRVNIKLVLRATYLFG